MTKTSELAREVGDVGYNARYVLSKDERSVKCVVLHECVVRERHHSWIIYTNGTHTNGAKYYKAPYDALLDLIRWAVSREEYYSFKWTLASLKDEAIFLDWHESHVFVDDIIRACAAWYANAEAASAGRPQAGVA